MGLWWRWQDLNLRPWDYDSPALSRIYQKTKVFFKDRKIKKTNFIIEDENLEKILNELNVKDIKEGTVIYESNFKKLDIKKTDN